MPDAGDDDDDTVVSVVTATANNARDGKVKYLATPTKIASGRSMSLLAEVLLRLLLPKAKVAIMVWFCLVLVL